MVKGAKSTACLDLNDIVTPIDSVKLEQLLIETGYDKTKTTHIVEEFRSGFDLGYRGPSNRTDLSSNLPLYVGTHADIWEKMIKEVELNRYASPFDEIPFDNFIQSPIGLVPKDNGKKTRLIFHLSFDFLRNNTEVRNSVNFYTLKEWCTVKYKDLDTAIKACIKLRQQVESGIFDVIMQDSNSPVIFYSKSDMVSAFRILPIKPGQRKWLVMKAQHPESHQIYYFVDKCLPFGASISCALFQSFSDALVHIAEVKASKLTLGIIIPITNYLDDFLFIAFLRELCNRLMTVFIKVCGWIGCPISKDKTVWAATQVVFLGMVLDGYHYTISIPTEKLIKAINTLCYFIQKKKVTIKQIQQLTGLFNFFN